MVSGLEGRVTALEKGSSTTKAPTATPAPAAGDGDDDFETSADRHVAPLGTHYPDSKPTSLCSFSLMLHA
jgi:hypothetical protein